MLISSFLGKTAVAPPLVSAFWILFVFSSWAMAFGVAYLRLSDLSVSVERDSGPSTIRSTGQPP